MTPFLVGFVVGLMMGISLILGYLIQNMPTQDFRQTFIQWIISQILFFFLGMSHVELLIVTNNMAINDDDS